MLVLYYSRYEIENERKALGMVVLQEFEVDELYKSVPETDVMTCNWVIGL